MPTDTATTLASVLNAFSQWRTNKTNHQKRIPQRLWQMVRQLANHHSSTLIKRKLSLSSTQWQRHVKPHRVDKPQPEPQADFFELVPAMQSSQPTSAPLTLELPYQDKTILLHAHSHDVLVTVLKQLMEN